MRKLDQLGRNLRDLITMLDDLRAIGVTFHSLTAAIGTTTPTGRAMWQMIGVLAELESSVIVGRTQAGMNEARRRCIKSGGKKRLTFAQIGKARKLIEAGERVEDVAALWNVSRTTLYRALPDSKRQHTLSSIRREEERLIY